MKHMDYLKMLRMLVACVFLLTSGTVGQLDGESMEICAFCHTEDLLDCNLTDVSHINLTVNCELTKLGCTLGIDESFQSFDNDTMEKITHKQVCLLRYDSGALSTPISTEPTMSMFRTTTESYEHPKIMTLMGPTMATDVIDYQDDQPTEITFRSDPVLETVENLASPSSETITCFVGTSSSDEACLTKADQLKTTECPKPSGCISIYIDGVLKRDCASSVKPEDVMFCNKPGNTSCICCPTSKCNTTPWKQCYQCNSKDDPNCALWLNAEAVPTEICPNHNDNCMIRITTDGDTVRECSRADFKCSQDELCSICDTPLCNIGVFPENRRRCIQCQECEDAQNPNNALPCPRYDPHEQCFLYVTGKSKMIRGCVSKTMDMQKCHMNEPKCITCGDTDGCNSMPLMKDATLSCSKCNSKDNPDCAWAQPLTAVAKCQNKVLYYLQETCMMEFDPGTMEAVRDCSFDYGVCTPEDSNCQTCNGDGCNRGGLKIQQCIQCSSKNPEQIRCSSQAEGIPSTKCPQETQIYQTKGCFTMNKGNVTIRDCIAGLTEDDLKFCKTEGKAHCELCMEDGCNNLLAPSIARKVTQISLLTSIFIGAILITV